MYQGLLHLHNLLRWVIIILAVIAIVRAFMGTSSRKPFSSTDKKIGLFLMVSAHITFLIGLYQWFLGDWGLNTIRNMGMGEVMKNSVYRYWAVEHLVGMFIAIALITVGRGISKKPLSDKVKHQRTLRFYLLALLVILITVPWPFRKGIGRPLFPGQKAQQTAVLNGEWSMVNQVRQVKEFEVLLPGSPPFQGGDDEK